MRIWSLHPQYLDTKGLLALWRETLLARHVLEGKTKGYRNHPQLSRFRAAADPAGSINQYLCSVYDEAVVRGYQFDHTKIHQDFTPVILPVTRGQVTYETTHLLRKLQIRDPARHTALMAVKRVKTHPMFRIIPGGVEPWEVIL